MRKRRMIIVAAILLVFALIAAVYSIKDNQKSPDDDAHDAYNSIAEVDAKTLDELEKTAQTAMLLCREVYENADKGDTYNVVLSGETLSQIVDAIGNGGYSVIDYAQEENMKNPERVTQFGLLVNSGQDAQTAYFEVYPDGNVVMNTLSYVNGTGKLITLRLEWSDEMSPTVCAAGQYDLTSIAYTEKGRLILERDISKMEINKKFNVDPHTLIRVAPYDETKRQLCRKYIIPIGYSENDLFTSSWDTDDYRDLDLNSLFPILYGLYYGTDALNMYNAGTLFEAVEGTKLHLVPGEQFEEVIEAFLPISDEQIRDLADHSADRGGYYICGFQTGYYNVVPRSPEPEVTDYWANSDGSLTLRVDAVFSWYGTDKAFTHELTVRDTETGFEYVSNYVYEDDDSIFPEQKLHDERIGQLRSITG